MYFSSKKTAGPYDVSLAYVERSNLRSRDMIMIVDYSNRIEGNDHPVTETYSYPRSNGDGGYYLPIIETSYDLLVTNEYADVNGNRVPLWYRHPLTRPVYATGASIVTRSQKLNTSATISSIDSIPLNDRTFVNVVPKSTGGTTPVVIRNTVRVWYASSGLPSVVHLPPSNVWFDGLGNAIIGSANIAVPITAGTDLTFYISFGVVSINVLAEGSREGSPYIIDCHSLDWSVDIPEKSLPAIKGTRFSVGFFSEYPDPIKVTYTTIDDYDRTDQIEEWTKASPIFTQSNGKFNDAYTLFNNRMYSTNPMDWRTFVLPALGDSTWTSRTNYVYVPCEVTDSLFAITMRDTSSPTAIHIMNTPSTSFSSPWTISVSPGRIKRTERAIYPSTPLLYIATNTPLGSNWINVNSTNDIVVNSELLGVVRPNPVTGVLEFIDIWKTTNVERWKVTSVVGTTLQFSDSALFLSDYVGRRLVFKTTATKPLTITPSREAISIVDSVIADNRTTLSTPIVRPAGDIKARKGRVELSVESVNTETGTITLSTPVDPNDTVTVYGRSKRNDRMLERFDLNPFTYSSAYYGTILDPLTKAFVIVAVPDYYSPVGGAGIYAIPYDKFLGNNRRIPTYDELNATINCPRYVDPTVVTGTAAFEENPDWYKIRYEARIGMTGLVSGSIYSDLYVVPFNTVYDVAFARDVELLILGIVEVITPLAREGLAYEVSDMRIYGGGMKSPVGSCHDHSRFDGEITDMGSFAKAVIPSDMLHELAGRLSEWDPELVIMDNNKGMAYEKAIEMATDSVRKHTYLGASVSVEIYGVCDLIPAPALVSAPVAGRG